MCAYREGVHCHIYQSNLLGDLARRASVVQSSSAASLHLLAGAQRRTTTAHGLQAVVLIVSDSTYSVDNRSGLGRQWT
eukprot:COSAG02_NODE_5427_length_4339_cov_2.935377_5_plen_78_part_00